MRAALALGTSFSGTPSRAPVAVSSIRRQPAAACFGLHGIRKRGAFLIAQNAGILAVIAPLEGFDLIDQMRIDFLGAHFAIAEQPDQVGLDGEALRFGDPGLGAGRRGVMGIGIGFGGGFGMRRGMSAVRGFGRLGVRPRRIDQRASQHTRQQKTDSNACNPRCHRHTHATRQA